jgi:hypothetical protein
MNFIVYESNKNTYSHFSFSLTKNLACKRNRRTQTVRNNTYPIAETQNKKPKILAVIPTLNDDPSETIESLHAQDFEISKIIVSVGSKKLFQELISPTSKNVQFKYVQPDFKKSLGERIGRALNTALNEVRLQDYDYLLKLDADTILPPRFVTSNVSLKSDIVGIFGFAMMLKISAFVKVLNGKWPETLGEDTYITHYYQMKGLSCKNYNLPPNLKRKSGVHHDWTYQFIRGIALYKLGYEPIHAFALSLDLRVDRKNLFIICGYAVAFLKRTTRYVFADFIFGKQLKELTSTKMLTNHTRITFF